MLPLTPAPRRRRSRRPPRVSPVNAPASQVEACSAVRRRDARAGRAVTSPATSDASTRPAAGASTSTGDRRRRRPGRERTAAHGRPTSVRTQPAPPAARPRTSGRARRRTRRGAVVAAQVDGHRRRPRGTLPRTTGTPARRSRSTAPSATGPRRRRGRRARRAGAAARVRRRRAGGSGGSSARSARRSASLDDVLLDRLDGDAALAQPGDALLDVVLGAVELDAR